jgi:hypothetical protein
MFKVKRLAALAVLLLAPLSAYGFGFSWLFRGPSTSYYYPAPQPIYTYPAVSYPAPVISYPAPRPAVAPVLPAGVPCPPQTMPAAIQGVPAAGFAWPTPAPPSSGPLYPRLGSPGPRSPEPPVSDPGSRLTIPMGPGGTTTPPPSPTPSGAGLPLKDQTAPPPLSPPMQPKLDPTPARKPESGGDLAPPPVPPPNPPGSTESRSYYDAYPVAVRNAEAAARDRCTVGIWNLSDRDVQVQVDGQTRTLPRGRKWTGEVPRQFRWQVVGKEARAEQVPEYEAGLEIVLRR